MPTSSQSHFRSQECSTALRSTPGSSKTNRLDNLEKQRQKTSIQQHNHHQSDPSLNCKDGKAESPLPKTPVHRNGLHRSRSIPSLQDRIHTRSEEKGPDTVHKHTLGVPKSNSGDRTPTAHCITPHRSGVQRTGRPLSSNSRQCTDNQQRHSLKSFQCEINFKLSATPDCYDKVQMETPQRREELGNLSGLAETETSNLTVGVRVRPLNNREVNDSNITNVVSVLGNEVTVKCDNSVSHTFVYDHCFLSDQPNHPQNAQQDTVFSTMVEPLIEKMFEGYTACLFAYGQTGSGKSYSMMGVDSDVDCTRGKEAGIIPRFCHKLFSQISVNESASNLSTTVEISYFEIYNEKIHDLLGGSTDSAKKPPLKVREHPVFGPYVEDLSVHGVTSFEDLKGWLKVGNSQRATAATGMNEKSSRSHSIFSVILTQTQQEEVLDEHHSHSKRSKINLVDLAGSERVSQTCASGDRLREGVSINRSLLTLGKVIAALSDNVHNRKKSFVPYRESILTWLLRESLGGNSKTAMLATVSPSSAHSEETLATLRYACQARTIVNRVRVNEDPNDRIIRQLRAEVDRLTALKADQKEVPLHEKDESEIRRKEQEIRRLKEQLKQSQEHLSKSDRSWSERLQEAEQKKSAELKYLRQCGLAIHLDWNEQRPCLVNLTADPILSGTLFYLLPPGTVQVGRSVTGNEDETPDICLSGPLVRRKHCTIQNSNGKLSLSPGCDGQTFVNGKSVNTRIPLHHGDRVVIGGNHYFRVSHPQDSMAQHIKHPVDYQFAYQEIHRVQENKLQDELEEAKRNALKELETARQKAEKELGSQRIHFEEQLKELGNTLQMHKDALSEISRKKELLEIEKSALEAEVQSHKARRTCAMEDSFVIAPYKTNFLQEVEDVLNATLCETESILRSSFTQESSSVNLHDMQVMIQEAIHFCKELGIPYDFSHEHIVKESSLKQRVKVKDLSNNVIAFWKPLYFMHWLDRLRHHDPDESLKELLNHEEIEWTEDDSEESDAEQNNRIMVNTKKVKRQLNESICQLSMDSCDSQFETSYEFSTPESMEDYQEAICDCIDRIENDAQDLQRLCVGRDEVKNALDALHNAVKYLKHALHINSRTRSFVELNEPSQIYKYTSSSTTPPKSNLRSPGLPGHDTPKTSKSVRFLLSESQQHSMS